MAKAFTPSTLAALSTARNSVSDLAPLQIFELATQGLLELSSAGELQLSKKADRGENRAARAAEIDSIRAGVYAAAFVAAEGKSENLFRLDDVLKHSGLDKSKHRDNILQCLRSFRDEGMLESVKRGDNNFQIFWKFTPEALS